MDVTQPIRILRIIARLNIGGPAIQAITLSGELNDGEYQTLLVCGKISPDEGDMAYLAKEKGVRPHIVSTMGREISFINDFKTFFRLRKIIKHFKPHLIHTHTAKAGLLGRLAALSINMSVSRMNKIRLVHTFHGHIFYGYFNRFKTLTFILFERFLARFTDRTIVVSQLQKIDICRKYGIAGEGRVRIISLGFDLSGFKKRNSERKIAREKYFPHGTQKTFGVGIIGRLTKVKNHAMLLKAIGHLKDLGKIGLFQFLIVGDGELKEKILSEANELNVSDSVVFSGWQKDMAPIYAALDAVVLTSKNEGTPVTLIEAMAAAKPVLATDVGGVPDLLGPVKMTTPQGFSIAERGIMVPPDNSKALAHALLFLYNKEDILAEMTLRAQSFVCEQFSIKRLLGDIKSLYEELA